MLCEKCNQNPASVHSVTIINGQKKECHLCSECAKEAQHSLPSIMDLLAGFGMVQAQQQVQEACGCEGSYAKFQKTGLLGCPTCYTAYRELLLPVIKRAQGGRLRHVGRRPAAYQNIAAEATSNEAPAEKSVQAASGQEQEISRLRRELQASIREERYERAAELRDRLRLLEGGGEV